MDRQSENPLQALPPVDLSASASDTSLPLVSVVSPTTYERRWTHESLYRQFANQSYPNKELCVLDTGPAPSPFFSTLDPPDDRVTYVHIQCDMSGMSMDQAVHALQTLALAAEKQGGSRPEVRGEAPAKALSTSTDDVRYMSEEWWRGQGTKDIGYVEAWEPTLTALGRARKAREALMARPDEEKERREAKAREEEERKEKEAEDTFKANLRKIWPEAVEDLSHGAFPARGSSLRPQAPTAAGLVKAGFTLGAKRNWLAATARGAIHANFDDDDVYLPSYLSRMVHALTSHGAALVKLGSWLEFNCVNGMCRRYGTSPGDDAAVAPALDGMDRGIARLKPAHSYLWGFGFSYVHTAQLAQLWCAAVGGPEPLGQHLGCPTSVAPPPRTRTHSFRLPPARRTLGGH